MSKQRRDDKQQRREPNSAERAERERAEQGEPEDARTADDPRAVAPHDAAGRPSALTRPGGEPLTAPPRR